MKAADIMATDLATVAPGQTIVDVIRCMVDRHVSGVPVVGPGGALLGMVTEGDLLRRAELGTAEKRSSVLAFLMGAGRLAEDYVRANTRAVEDIMTRDMVSIAPETDLAEIVALMERHRVKRLPVVRDGACVGIVSRADIVRALGQALEAAHAALAGDDATIHQRILDEMTRAGFGWGERIRVTVMDGVVALDGVIFDAREREAMLVLVRNIAGVKGCTDRITFVEPSTGMRYEPEKSR